MAAEKEDVEIGGPILKDETQCKINPAFECNSSQLPDADAAVDMRSPKALAQVPQRL